MTPCLQRLGKCDGTAGEQLRLVGEVVVPITCSSHLLWGRDEGGQSLHMDGAVHRAMVASGYCDHMPPLGALNRNEQLPRSLTFTLGGDEFPFRVFGWAEHRPNREIEETLLEPLYKEAGWRVEWGPEFLSEKDGYVRTFRLTNSPAETLGPEVGTYFALVRSEHGELPHAPGFRVVVRNNEWLVRLVYRLHSSPDAIKVLPIDSPLVCEDNLR